MLYEDPYYDEVIQYYAYTSNGECPTEVANFRPPKNNRDGQKLHDPAYCPGYKVVVITRNLGTTILITPVHFTSFLNRLHSGRGWVPGIVPGSQHPVVLRHHGDFCGQDHQKFMHGYKGIIRKKKRKE